MSFRERYLLWFVNQIVEFRLPEIESLKTLLNLDLKWIDGPNKTPFWIVEASSEDLEKLASRSITLRSVIKLWGSGSTLKELHENLKRYPNEKIQRYLNEKLSFRIDVETFGKKISMKEKISKMELFDYLPANGPVKLNDPDVNLYFIEYYGLDPTNVPDSPCGSYFGVWVCDGQKGLVSKYSLKNRKFIGNTSMDPQLSFIMANQALVKKGDLVMDPFVGSGSLLVAAAHFGAFVMGVDIDYLMLHGKSKPSRLQANSKSREKDESIFSNMLQYGTESQYIDVLVGDSSLPMWHDNLKLDSIITDPPYGVREATARIGSEKKYIISSEHIESHIPSKIDYSICQIFIDLLTFAAKHLKLRGRLVSWIPVYKAEYNLANLPSHPCLKLVFNSEQTLTSLTSRRLLTWEKISECNETDNGATAVDMFPLGFREHYFGHGETRKQRKARIAQELVDKGLTYCPKNRIKGSKKPE